MIISRMIMVAGRVRISAMVFAVAAALAVLLVTGGIGCSTGFVASTEEETPEAPSASGIAVGMTTFAENCAVCHGDAGQGHPDWQSSNADGTLNPPPLNGDGHTWHHGDGLLYRIVREGGKMQEDPVLLPNFKSAMPAFGAQLSHEEIVAVLTYIKGWWGDKTSRGLSIVEAQANKSIGDPFPDG